MSIKQADQKTTSQDLFLCVNQEEDNVDNLIVENLDSSFQDQPPEIQQKETIKRQKGQLNDCRIERDKETFNKQVTVQESKDKQLLFQRFKSQNNYGPKTNKYSNPKKINTQKEQINELLKEIKLSQKSSAKSQILSNLQVEKSFGYENYKKGFEPTSKGNIKLAQLHNQAKKIKKVSFEDVQNNTFCDCCGFPVEGQKYKITCNVDEFADFGVGFSLYFIYLKFVILLLVLAFLPFGLIM